MNGVLKLKTIFGEAAGISMQGMFFENSLQLAAENMLAIHLIITFIKKRE